MIWKLIEKYITFRAHERLQNLPEEADYRILLEEEYLNELSKEAEDLFWLAVDYIEYGGRRGAGLLCKEEEWALYELIKACAKVLTIKFAPGYCREYIRQSAGLRNTSGWTMNDVEYWIMYNGSPRKGPEVFISFERAEGYGITIRYNEEEKRYRVGFHS